MTALAEFVVEAPSEPWGRIGLDVRDHVARVGSVRLRFVPGDRGVISWGLTGVSADLTEIDGLPTFAAATPDGDAPPNAMGASGFDHIIVSRVVT